MLHGLIVNGTVGWLALRARRQLPLLKIWWAIATTPGFFLCLRWRLRLRVSALFCGSHGTGRIVIMATAGLGLRLRRRRRLNGGVSCATCCVGAVVDVGVAFECPGSSSLSEDTSSASLTSVIAVI